MVQRSVPRGGSVFGARHQDSGRIAQHDAVFRQGKAQHVARDLLDEIGVGLVWSEKGNVALQFGAHGLEAADLEVQQLGPLHQLCSCLEAVTSMNSVKDEVGCHCDAAKQHRKLLQPRTSIMSSMTHHFDLFVVTRNEKRERLMISMAVLKAR